MDDVAHEHQAAGGDHHHHDDHGPVRNELFTDPVCGMKVGPDRAREVCYAGETYHFCSPHCMGKFTAAPEQYARVRVEQKPPTGTLPLLWGAFASVSMLAVYFLVLTLASGWEVLTSEFARYWVYLVPLALGFGVQVGLFMRLRDVAGRAMDSGAVTAASGTTSTAAMVSCCAHYLANVAPVIGATGLVAFAAQFQVQIFWLGLLFNLAGIAYVARQLAKASKEHEKCLA